METCRKCTGFTKRSRRSQKHGYWQLEAIDELKRR